MEVSTEVEKQMVDSLNSVYIVTKFETSSLVLDSTVSEKDF